MAEVKVAKRILTELDSTSFVDVDTYNTHNVPYKKKEFI